MNENIVEIPVRFNEQDEMGIVHNSVYYIWFEIARNNFAYSILDMSYQELKEMGIQSPVIHSECNYIRPARFMDIVQVKCCYEPSEKNILTLYYEVINKETLQKLATGKTVNVFLNSTGRLMVERPQFLINAIDRVMKRPVCLWQPK